MYTSPLDEPTVALELETKFPLIWAEETHSYLAKNHAPILIDLKPGAQPAKIRPYMVLQETRLGIQVHLDQLLKWEVLK